MERSLHQAYYVQQRVNRGGWQVRTTQAAIGFAEWEFPSYVIGEVAKSTLTSAWLAELSAFRIKVRGRSALAA